MGTDRIVSRSRRAVRFLRQWESWVVDRRGDRWSCRVIAVFVFFPLLLIVSRLLYSLEIFYFRVSALRSSSVAEIQPRFYFLFPLAWELRLAGRPVCVVRW